MNNTIPHITSQAAGNGHPPIGYPIGTILHETNAIIDNLWIIYQDNSFKAALLYDGKLKKLTNGYKTDIMKPGMQIATEIEILCKIGQTGTLTTVLPQWALGLININPMAKPMPNLSQGAINQITKHLGTGLPPEAKPHVIAHSSESCTDGKPHNWHQYFGFTDNFDYCSKCDKKVRMKQ